MDLTPLSEPHSQGQSNPNQTSHLEDVPYQVHQISASSSIRIVCISDTHCTQPSLPEGDILLHAGDLTNKGSFEEIQAQLGWLKEAPHKYKVVIAGNHDVLLDPAYVKRFPDRIYEGEGTSQTDLNWGDIIYLNRSSIKLDFPNGRSLDIYGSPLTEQFGTWAFQYPPIRDVWTNSIPKGTDILLTHGPPRGHLDLGGKGCRFLLKEIWRVRPRLVVFGHIHADHGQQAITYSSDEASYDIPMMGEIGVWATFVIRFRLASEKLSELLCWRSEASSSTTLVNAAVVGGPGNVEGRPAIVIDI
ncbi:Metallo-dependent phosphatase [Hypoxylon trugodes]|uniref:Metallo-dependent phosphatase n=1 Tax=Hypoxylon trugodes TaxID=326681 RepID=UPI00219C8E36|nr:Metallo-dependent phosphatase [Hypoxylon trugodes]KAI1388826.1 Metallo-dependent phosphatase [Hypoxylon trugodes]